MSPNRLTTCSKGMIVLLAILAFSGGTGRASGPALPSVSADRGEFVISMEGRKVGTESFEIRPSADGVEATATIHYRLRQEGKTAEYTTSPRLVLTPGLIAQTYSWAQKGPQSSSLEVDFRTSPAKVLYHTLDGASDQREFQLLKDVVVIDNNVFHHFQLLVDRYRMTDGGKQTFAAFVPQDASPGQVTIEDTGKEQAKTLGRHGNLDHLLVTTDLMQIDLWVDEQSRVQRVAIPSAKIEAVRK